MAFKATRIKDIPTQIKDEKLVAGRRRQIVDAPVELFMALGFHKTTTRQIASAAGISIGLLYLQTSFVLQLMADNQRPFSGNTIFQGEG